MKIHYEISMGIRHCGEIEIPDDEYKEMTHEQIIDCLSCHGDVIDRLMDYGERDILECSYVDYDEEEK